MLLVGFEPQPGGDSEFRTQIATGRISVPTLTRAVGARAGVIISLIKSARNPYGAFIFVGRAGTNDVVFKHPSLSKSHAAFEPLEGGQWHLRDNGSRNGTHIDGVRLAPNEPVVVASGRQITFGSFPTYFLTTPELDGLLRGELPPGR